MVNLNLVVVRTFFTAVICHTKMYLNLYLEVLPLNNKTLTPYPSGIDGTLYKYRVCGEVWKAAGMVMPAYTSETCLIFIHSQSLCKHHTQYQYQYHAKNTFPSNGVLVSKIRKIQIEDFSQIG